MNADIAFPRKQDGCCSQTTIINVAQRNNCAKAFVHGWTGFGRVFSMNVRHRQLVRQ
jgi:hypothetical protein